ncbi:MAG: hypothetical protein FWC93_02685 [Defluviitaleaceae bacterium]|nr:hypothetical protein [Defluviitaleaceae bacterium]
MIDFNEELKKYKPVLGVEELQDGVSGNDVKDIMELLQHLSGKVVAPGKEKE